MRCVRADLLSLLRVWKNLAIVWFLEGMNKFHLVIVWSLKKCLKCVCKWDHRIDPAATKFLNCLRWLSTLLRSWTILMRGRTCQRSWSARSGVRWILARLLISCLLQTTKPSSLKTWVIMFRRYRPIQLLWAKSNRWETLTSVILRTALVLPPPKANEAKNQLKSKLSAAATNPNPPQIKKMIPTEALSNAWKKLSLASSPTTYKSLKSKKRKLEWTTSKFFWKTLLVKNRTRSNNCPNLLKNCLKSILKAKTFCIESVISWLMSRLRRDSSFYIRKSTSRSRLRGWRICSRKWKNCRSRRVRELFLCL